MKVSIIGGGGLVGSMTAYALQCGGVASSICLIDANKDQAQGQALDLLHGASLVADQRIHAGDYNDIPSSNIVVFQRRLVTRSRFSTVMVSGLPPIATVMADVAALTLCQQETHAPQQKIRAKGCLEQVIQSLRLLE